MSTPERLLELLAHRDPDVQRQGVELLRALPPSLRRDTYAIAAQRRDWQAAAQVSSGGDPVRLAWHRRRMWSTAARILCTHHAAHGADLDGQMVDLLDTLHRTLAQPPTASARVAVGGLRLKLLERKRALPRHTPPPWTPPAHVLFYQQRTRLSVAEARERYRTDQTALFCHSSHERLAPWVATPEQFLGLSCNLSLLKIVDEDAVSDGLRRQELLQRDGASMTTQRALFARLDEEQRARAAVILREADEALRAQWVTALLDLGAAPDSLLFAQ